jgi:hypothetical protein
MQRPIIKLFPSVDTDGSTMYVGRWHWPGYVDFSEGVAFLVYPAVEGQGELHICPLTSPDLSNVFDYYSIQRQPKGRNRNANLTIPLEVRYERTKQKRKFYIGKIDFKGVIDCGIKTPGVAFLVFLADEGEEELQLTVMDPNKMGRKKAERKYIKTNDNSDIDIEDKLIEELNEDD